MVFLRRFGAPALVVGALALLLATGAHAQTVTGSIYGRVVDTTGAVLPGATVTVTNPDTGRTRTAVSNNRGQYTVTFLPPGLYDVSIALDGFKTYTETGVEVGVGEERDLTAALEVGAMTELVTVQSETPLLNTTSAEQNVKVAEQMVMELPMNRRDITALLEAGPGLNLDDEFISINGMPGQSFTFSVDGVDATTDPEFGGGSLSQTGDFNYIKGVSVEAVKEVEISKNIFSAEVGMTLSGNINMITKSGTNVWHGSGFFNIQRGDWNAGDPITDVKEPERYEAFGGSIGGPIVKDKVFFFGVYEGYRMERDTVINDFVPTREFKDAVIAAIPGSQPYWDLWEDPNTSEIRGIEGRLITTHFEERWDNHFVGRLDFNISDTSFLNVRYIHARPLRNRPATALGNNRVWDGFNDNIQANFTKIHNPNLTSEWRFGWGKAGADRIDQLWAANALTIAVPGIDDTDGEANNRDGGNLSFGSVWSLQKGAHALRFGGNFRRFNVQRFNEEMPIWEYASVDDLLANRADFVAFQLALENFLLSGFDYGFFIQDDYRVTRDLMLNIGLRWDYSAVPSERDGRLWNRDGALGGLEQRPYPPLYRPADSSWDANYNLWSPRFGFAWSMSEKTVIRGGAGIFYIPFNMYSGPVEIVFNGSNDGSAADHRPFEVEFTGPQLEALGITYPTFNEDVEEFAGAVAFSGDSSVANDRPNPRTYQWTLGLSQQLTDTLAWDIAYIGNNGRKLTVAERINRPDRFTAVNPVAGLAAPRYYHQIDNTNYHAMQTSLRRRFQDNFGFGMHYTYSSNTGLMANSFTCCHEELNSQTERDYRNVHSYVSTHARHRLWADILYELPFGEGLWAEGWLVGGIFRYTSGGPIQVRDRGGSGYRMDRPDYLADKPVDAVIDNQIDEFNWQYLDPSLFARVPRTEAGIQERPGSAPRAAWINPGAWSLDLSLSKSFRFGRSSRVQLRWDLFNATNHANRGNARNRIDSSRFGQINGISGIRIMQLGVRFDF